MWDVDQGRQTSLRKTVGAVSLVVWVFANSGLWYHYAETRPREPNPATGNTFALNTHGSVVYLTIQDSIVLYGTMAAGLVGALFMAFLPRRRA